MCIRHTHDLDEVMVELERYMQAMGMNVAHTDNNTTCSMTVHHKMYRA